IDLPHERADRRDERQRIARGPQMEDVGREKRLLAGRHVKHSHGILTKTAVLAVLYHAYDLDIVLILPESDSSPDRVLAAEVVTGKGLVDDGGLGPVHVARGEIAAGDQWDSQGGEVSGQHGAEAG